MQSVSLPVLPIDVAFMQQSSSHQSQVLSNFERGHMQVSAGDHCERTIHFTALILPGIRSMKGVSFTMLKAGKA